MFGLIRKLMKLAFAMAIISALMKKIHSKAGEKK